MNTIVKKKLCWNCEGQVSHEEENCPFCGVYLNGTIHIQNQIEEDNNEVYQPNKSSVTETKTETAAAPYSPPYTPETPVMEKEQEKPNHHKAPEPAAITNISSNYGMKTDFIPLFLLLSGSIIFLFSLILLLFSHNGTLTLKW